jgi:hypothetical protein
MLFRRTYEAAKAWEGGCEFVELRNASEPVDPTKHRPTYPELLTGIWAQCESVIVLEHDVVPYEHSLDEIAHCLQPWCGFHYPDGGGVSGLKSQSRMHKDQRRGDGGHAGGVPLLGQRQPRHKAGTGRSATVA